MRLKACLTWSGASASCSSRRCVAVRSAAGGKHTPVPPGPGRLPCVPVCVERASALVTCRAAALTFPAWGVFSSQLSKKDHGEYKATLKDDRGQDVSTLEIAGKGNTKPSLFP